MIYGCIALYWLVCAFFAVRDVKKGMFGTLYFQVIAALLSPLLMPIVLMCTVFEKIDDKFNPGRKKDHDYYSHHFNTAMMILGAIALMSLEYSSIQASKAEAARKPACSCSEER